jgi:hypothetical protein
MIFGANYNPKSVYYKFKELFRTFIAPARETQSPRQLIKKGDANKDGQITSGDSQIVFDIYLRKRSAPANISYIDMNNDGQITPKDANIITNIYLGKCAADGLTNISNVCDSTNCGSAEGCNKMKPSTGNCDEKCSLIKRNICNDGISYELSSNHVAYDRNSRQETSYIIPGTSIKLGIKNLQTGITDFNSGYTFESDKPSVVKIQGNLGIDNITKYDNYDMLVNVSIPELRNCKNIKQPIKTIIGDPFLQDDIGYIYPKSIIPKNVLNPNQEWATISVEQAMNKFQLPKTAELTYKLQTDLFGVKPINGDAIILALMPSWCGGAGPITGFGVGCLIGPNNEPQWGVIFHEIGHVFTGHFQLEWVDGLGGIYPTNSKIFMTFSDNFGLAFSEATATLASMYTEYYLIKNYSQYGLNQDTFDSLDRHFKTRQGYVNDLRNYEKDGNNFAKIDANILDGIFIEIANDNGINPFGWDLYPRAFKAYLNPLPSFISGPLTGIQSHTYFIASLTAASGSDLRTKFKGYGFPIDDAYFEKILPVLQKKLGSNITAPEKPIITETESPTTSTLLKSESTNKIYEVIDNKKLWIPTVEAFNKVGLEWGDVQNVSEAKANQYSRLKLARIAGDPRVYYLTEGGLKRWIPNEQVFTSYNNKWEDVVEISPTKLNIYPNNILIKLDNETRVYKLENNQKRWIKTAEAFNRLGFDWTKIAPVNQTEFNYYQEGAQIE